MESTLSLKASIIYMSVTAKENSTKNAKSLALKILDVFSFTKEELASGACTNISGSTALQPKVIQGIRCKCNMYIIYVLSLILIMSLYMMLLPLSLLSHLLYKNNNSISINNIYTG